jgi:pilus assembly protein CpaF
MKALLLLSQEAGAGRSLLAANLAPLLAALDGGACLLETGGGESDLALHRGEAPQEPALALRRGLGVGHARVADPGQLGALLSGAAERGGWVLVDGLSLQDDWQPWARACGRVLLVERGDLTGCRRMLRAVQALSAAHWPLAHTQAVWMGSQEAQPLPPLPGLNSHSVPWHAKAVERLAHASLISVDEPKSPFTQALKRLAAALPAVEAFSQAGAGDPAGPEAHAEPDESRVLSERLGQQLRQRLDAMEHGGVKEDGDFRAAWEPRVRQLAQELLAKESAPWLTQALRAQLVERLLKDTLGLGPLEDLLADPEVSEIMVNHPQQVYVERAGRLALSPLRFRDAAQLKTIIERIVAPLGRRIDESSPKVDARLPDGSRVNAIIPPLALKGPCLTIRKFPARRLTMEELVARGALGEVAARFLRQAVESRQNILVSGGTGSGKTTLLNALSAYIPAGERVITIEDSAELKLQQPHVVTLEARSANLEGQGEVSIRDLLVNSLRMRPDRIVVGECRGGEALDMLQAMNTGHEGSLTTLHANTARDALHRLETLCLMSGVELPLLVVRRQIASALDLVLQIGRLRDGSRRVLSITEVTGMEGDVVSCQDLFSFVQTGIGAGGAVLGSLRATGVPARLYQKLKAAGEAADFSVFETS